MKKEYDFSRGVRGKFYSKGARISIPVYLDAGIRPFIERLARSRRKDPSTVVNELLREDMRLAQIMK